MSSYQFATSNFHRGRPSEIAVTSATTSLNRGNASAAVASQPNPTVQNEGRAVVSHANSQT